MIKQAPTIGRMIAMVVFTLSVFGLLMFLWLAFGGPIPLKPESYRLKARFQEAPTLAVEADVRLAGVNVGKVKKKELDKRGSRTIVELEVEDRYAPIPKDTRAILRQKTLLGETYVQLSPGHREKGALQDGETLPNSQIEPTVELDEIFTAFDPKTRASFQEWIRELSKAIGPASPRRSQDLNDAFGNLEGLAVDGAELLRVLDEQEIAVRRLIKNTGVVFGAINEREGALRSLIRNSHNTFQATASRDESLAETFRIFPTFLDESRATMARLERFSRNTRPLVRDLRGPADDLGPTVRDLGRLAPRLTKLFRDLRPLIRASRRGLPALQRILRGARPLLGAGHLFFTELNPILSYLHFHQRTVAGFLHNGGANLSGDWGTGQRLQIQVGIIDGRSFEPRPEEEGPPFWSRGNAYVEPNAYQRAIALGAIEVFSCSHETRADGRRGEQIDPDDQLDQPVPLIKNENKSIPCLVEAPSLYSGKQFSVPQRGQAPKKAPPGFRDGNRPAVDPKPNDPNF